MTETAEIDLDAKEAEVREQLADARGRETRASVATLAGDASAGSELAQAQADARTAQTLLDNIATLRQQRAADQARAATQARLGDRRAAGAAVKRHLEAATLHFEAAEQEIRKAGASAAAGADALDEARRIQMGWVADTNRRDERLERIRQSLSVGPIMEVLRGLVSRAGLIIDAPQPGLTERLGEFVRNRVAAARERAKIEFPELEDRD